MAKLHLLTWTSEFNKKKTKLRRVNLMLSFPVQLATPLTLNPTSGTAVSLKLLTFNFKKAEIPKPQVVVVLAETAVTRVRVQTVWLTVGKAV